MSFTPTFVASGKNTMICGRARREAGVRRRRRVRLGREVWA